MEENISTQPQYVIAAAAYQIDPILKLLHCFWCLIDTKRNIIVAVLHGLSTSRSSGERKAIGWNCDHEIKFHYVVYDEEFAKKNSAEQYRDTWRLEENRLHIFYEGTDALQRWNRGVMGGRCINEQSRTYPLFGIAGIFGYKINSNGVFHTLGDCMFPEKAETRKSFYIFPDGMPVGIEHTLYPEIKNELGQIIFSEKAKKDKNDYSSTPTYKLF